MPEFPVFAVTGTDSSAPVGNGTSIRCWRAELPQAKARRAGAGLQGRDGEGEDGGEGNETVRSHQKPPSEPKLRRNLRHTLPEDTGKRGSRWVTGSPASALHGVKTSSGD